MAKTGAHPVLVVLCILKVRVSGALRRRRLRNLDEVDDPLPTEAGILGNLPLRHAGSVGGDDLSVQILPSPNEGDLRVPQSHPGELTLSVGHSISSRKSAVRL
jgi:hypothetical protein